MSSPWMIWQFVWHFKQFCMIKQRVQYIGAFRKPPFIFKAWMLFTSQKQVNMTQKHHFRTYNLKELMHLLFVVKWERISINDLCPVEQKDWNVLENESTTVLISSILLVLRHHSNKKAFTGSNCENLLLSTMEGWNC